jgi:hypothetical protein
LNNTENFDVLSLVGQLNEIMQKEDKTEALNLLKEKLGEDIPITEDDLRGPMSKEKIGSIIQYVRPRLSVQQQMQLDFMIQMFLK